MAYREYDMWEILDALRRIQRRETQKAIEAATGHTRKTIRRYVRTAEKLGSVGSEAGAERGTRFGGVAEASAGSDARLRGDRGAARTASGRYLPMAFRQPWRAGIDAGQGPGASVSPMGVCFLWFSAPVRGT